jgi:hypothetical protein
VAAVTAADTTPVVGGITLGGSGGGGESVEALDVLLFSVPPKEEFFEDALDMVL